MSALFHRHIACTAPQQYYLCAANGFNGCCSVDPCSLPDCPDASRPRTTSTTAAVTGIVSAFSPAAALSGNDPLALTTAQLATPQTTSMPQETPSDYSSKFHGQSTADATALQPTSSLTRASVNGILFSTSGDVIILEPTNNGMTPAQTSTFIATILQLSANTATISRTSSAITTNTKLGASTTPTNTASLAADHNSSTNTKHPVVGGAIGGAAAAAIITVAILLCCRRLKRVKRVKRERKEEQIVVDQTPQTYVVNLNTRSR